MTGSRGTARLSPLLVYPSAQLSLTVLGPCDHDQGSVSVETVGCEGSSRCPFCVVPETHALDTP